MGRLSATGNFFEEKRVVFGSRPQKRLFDISKCVWLVEDRLGQSRFLVAASAEIQHAENRNQ
jgi:hypothetical protein